MSDHAEQPNSDLKTLHEEILAIVGDYYQYKEAGDPMPDVPLCIKTIEGSIDHLRSWMNPECLLSEVYEQQLSPDTMTRMFEWHKNAKQIRDTGGDPVNDLDCVKELILMMRDPESEQAFEEWLAFGKLENSVSGLDGSDMPKEAVRDDAALNKPAAASKASLA